MNTITEKRQKIADFIADKHLCSGIGDRQEMCSVAAINLAITGRLTDEIPACMSPVIGKWIIAIQDRMPDVIRNSQGWRELLPLTAGTGREHEAERLHIIMDWMWDALALIQPIGNKNGFGQKWEILLAADAARAARAARAADAADAAAYAASRAAAHVTNSWSSIDPVGLLRKLIDVTENSKQETTDGHD